MNPVAFKLFGMPVHWYGLIIATGLVLAVILATRLAKYRNLPKDLPFELILWVFPPAIICARLYFLIFNGGPWDENAFAIWNGGIAIYGAIIGGALGALLFCIIRKRNFLDIADLVMPCLILGQCIGRWGNFANQEAYGLALGDSCNFFPIGVYIENCYYSGCACDGSGWHMATFFYESICSFIICIALCMLIKKCNIRGMVLSTYMIAYGTVRFITEGLRMDSLMVGTLRTSQVLSLIIIAGGIALMIYLLDKYKYSNKQPKPALVDGNDKKEEQPKELNNIANESKSDIENRAEIKENKAENILDEKGQVDKSKEIQPVVEDTDLKENEVESIDKEETVTTIIEVQDGVKQRKSKPKK